LGYLILDSVVIFSLYYMTF